MVRSTLLMLGVVLSAPLLAQSKSEVTSVSRAKVMTNAEAEFARVDANKDGQMTRAEIENFQRSLATNAATARNKAVFAELDSDKNGQLSQAEFAKLTPASPKIDASGVLRVDTNKDGQVSLAEHRAATLDTFVQVDSNKDGMITAVEVQAASRK